MSFVSAIILSFSILLPLVAGLLIKEKSVFLNKFLNFLIVGFITEIILIVTSFIGNNLMYFNVYTMIEVLLISFIYIELINNSLIKNLIWFFSILIISSGVFFFKFDVINSTTKFYESLFVIGCGVAYFFFNQKDKISLSHYFINIGFILFFACNLLIYLFSEIYINQPIYEYLYSIHSYVNFGVNIIFFVGLLLLRRKDEEYLHKLKNLAIEEYIYMSSVPPKIDNWYGEKK